MSLYIVTHKNYEFPCGKNYFPVVVGKAINNVKLSEELNPVYDDDKDNISILNREFCELTALYWLWKNSDDDVIGICHYRRYFKSKNDNVIFKDIHIFNNKDMEELNFDIDIVIPKKITFGRFSVMQQYYRSHYIQDMNLIRNCIKKIHPEYIVSFDNVMSQTTLHPYNMIIAKKEIYNSYCEWLFSILFEYKDIADIADYNPYQKRVFGFLSERLFTVWVFHNFKNYKFKEYDVVTTEETPVVQYKLKDKLMLRAQNTHFFVHKMLSKILLNILQ